MASIMRRQGEIKRPMFATTNIEDEESDQNQTIKIRAPSHFEREQSKHPLDSFLNDQTFGDTSRYEDYEKSIVIRTDSVMKKLMTDEGNDQTMDMYNTILDSESNTGSLNQPPLTKQETQKTLKPFFHQNIESPMSGNMKQFEFDVQTPSSQPNDTSRDSEQFPNSLKLGSLDLKAPFINNIASPDKSNIGRTEISFIKKDQTSFVDSFLQEQEKLLEAQKYKERPDDTRDTLLGGELDMALFNDIIEEEFDLDNMEDFITDITPEIEIESPTVIPAKQQGPSKGGRFFIETVLEQEEDEDEEETP